MSTVFSDFNITDFWEGSEYATQEYVEPTLTQEQVDMVEQTLGYKLPSSYIELMSFQNGGIPRNIIHRTGERTSWADDHVAITGLYSIGQNKPNSLCGEFGSNFWIDMWNYPPIGVYFADCPSAGHDMLCLDYSKCGMASEPMVVHIDQEWDYKVTFVAKNFESFIRGLESQDTF